MALAIDASTPAIATNTVSGTATVATASFTPPTGALLLIRWAGNTHSPGAPSTPTITDSLGAHLTYTLLDWQSRSDSPTKDGQAAQWWAKVGTSAAMTVTVTNVVGGAATERQAALHVTVITGQDGTTPIGAHGKSGSASASSIGQSYTASATSGWGFLAYCDWDDKGAATAGTGCTLTNGGSGSIAGVISYGFIRRSSADDTSGGSNTLNATLPGTSTNLSWVYAEVLPATSGTVNGTATLAGAGALSAAVVEGVTATSAGAGAVANAVTQGTTASVAGAGALTVSAVQRTTASPAGAGALSANVVEGVTATLPGAGAVTALASERAGTSPAGAGALTSAAVQIVPATLTGAGAVSATGTVTGGTVNGVATIVGAGAVAALVTEGVRATVAGTGALTAATVQSTGPSLAGAGALTATVSQLATASPTGVGSLTALVQQLAGALLDGAGVLTATASGGAPDDCTTLRPFSGTTSRLVGATLRPNSGLTDRPDCDD